MASGAVALTQCPQDGKWCSGKDLNSTACCAANVDRIEIAATLGVSSPTNTMVSMSSSTVSPGGTSNGTSSLETSISAPAKSSSNVGIKIGLGIGIGVGLTGLVAAVAIVFLRRRQHNRKGDSNTESASNVKMHGSVYSTIYSRHELADSPVSRKVELEARSREVFELN